MASRRADSAPRRLDTVDFWRGVVLCTIFVNHVPGNLFERLTFRNFGLSDSAEAFVFISGLALALAYGRRFAAGAVGAASRSLGRRAGRLYLVHIGLSILGVAIFAAGAAVFADGGLMQAHGRDLVVADPRAAMVGLVSLGHQFGYFNILPLYVVLVAFTPVLLVLAQAGRTTMLLVSFALYAVTRVTGLNLPTWPVSGSWFLDPFAWQFLMAIGIACGLGLAGPARPPRRALVALAAAILLVGLVVSTNGFGWRPTLFDDVRRWGDLDKTMLGVGRLVHFLALAYLVAALDVAGRLRASTLVGPLFAPLCLLGRNGLQTFALLSLFAATGQVLATSYGHTLSVDVMVVFGGLSALYGCTLLIQAAAAPSVARRARGSSRERVGALHSGGRTTL